MKLSFLEKTSINNTLLKKLRYKLLDKEQSIIPWPGKEYIDASPASLSLLGSIAEMPNPMARGNPKPQSMGMVLLIGPSDRNVISLQVSGQFDVYFRTIPSVSQQNQELIISDDGEVKSKISVRQIYRRVTVVFEDVEIKVDLNNDLRGWSRPMSGNALERAVENIRNKMISEESVFRRLQTNKKGRIERKYKYRDGSESDQDRLNSAIYESMFDSEADVIPFSPAIRARARVAPSTLAGTKTLFLVEVFFENTMPNETPRAYGMRECHFLDTRIRIKVSEGTSNQLPHRLEPVDYRYKGDSSVPGYGITTSIIAEAANVFRSDSMPVSASHKISNPRPRDLGMKFEPLFSLLASDPIPMLCEFLESIKGYLNLWGKQIDALKQDGDVREAAASDREMQQLVDELENIADGIRLLQQNPELLQSFKWMNEIVELSFLQQNKAHVKSWHLFQLGFILTQVRSVYERCCPVSDLSGHIDTAEILWFATGGGKTEAYLGLFIMSMVYERLNYRLFGPTAWLKFPLRMLSLQQFQRLSYVIAQANKLKKRENIEGHPFTLGYFTGGGTPNTISRNFDGSSFLPEIDSESLQKYRFIDDCPYCAEEDSVVVIKEVNKSRIKHVCTNEECWSNVEAPDGEYGEGIKGELGIYISDEEVYRYCPTVLVGTIDKLATIAFNKNYTAFFGKFDYFCPVHGFTRSEKCQHFVLEVQSDGSYKSEKCSFASSKLKEKTIKTGNAGNHGFSFILQDELHLLSENTGNFNAHYESLLQTLQSASGARKPKVIAATATIKGFEHHIHHIYQLEARRFPVPGFRKNESFYSRVDRDQAGNPITRRLFAGILPLGNSTGSSVVEQASAIASMRFLELIDELVELASISQNDFATEMGIDKTKCDVTADYLKTYLNTCLIYIRSQKIGDGVIRYFRDMQLKKHPDWLWRKLDGDSSLSEVQQAIKHVESKEYKNLDRQLIATNLISHGVDMHRLNFMVFAGWPVSIAEYMQSSARAGRVEPGIILVLLLNSDLFQGTVFLNFNDYHKFIDRLIESVPVNRFAPNLLERTLPGIISACVYNWAKLQPWGDMVDRNGKQLKDALRDSKTGARTQLKDMIISVLIPPQELVNQGYFDFRVIKDFQDKLDRELERLFIGLENMLPELLDKRLDEILERLLGQGPMRNFRSIEQPVDIKMNNLEDQGLLEALSGGT